MDSVNTNKIIFEVDWSKRVDALIHKTGYLSLTDKSFSFRIWRLLNNGLDGAVISLNVIIVSILFWSTVMESSSDGYVEPHTGRP